MGVSVSSEAGGGQAGKVSLRTLKPLASLRSSRASEGNQVSRGSGARGLRPKMSERLVGSAGLGIAGGGLADDAVRVLAAATRAA